MRGIVAGRAAWKKRDISNHSYNSGSVGSSVAEVNRSSAAGFAGGLIAGIIGANNVPNNRLDKAGGNWVIPSN